MVDFIVKYLRNRPEYKPVTDWDFRYLIDYLESEFAPRGWITDRIEIRDAIEEAMEEIGK